jgi:thiamine-phosphate diphosphorylase
MAGEDGADYVSLGPVFHTPSKEDLVPELGVDGLRRLCRKASLPVIAIGGIRPEHVAEVLDAGAWGFAVIRAVLDSDDPGAAASQLRAALDAAL